MELQLQGGRGAEASKAAETLYLVWIFPTFKYFFFLVLGSVLKGFQTSLNSVFEAQISGNSIRWYGGRGEGTGWERGCKIVEMEREIEGRTRGSYGKSEHGKWNVIVSGRPCKAPQANVNLSSFFVLKLKADTLYSVWPSAFCVLTPLTS